MRLGERVTNGNPVPLGMPYTRPHRSQRARPLTWATTAARIKSQP